MKVAPSRTPARNSGSNCPEGHGGGKRNKGRKLTETKSGGRREERSCTGLPCVHRGRKCHRPSRSVLDRKGSWSQAQQGRTLHLL